jgi:hypothetical protein
MLRNIVRLPFGTTLSQFHPPPNLITHFLSTHHSATISFFSIFQVTVPLYRNSVRTSRLTRRRCTPSSSYLLVQIYNILQGLPVTRKPSFFDRDKNTLVVPSDSLWVTLPITYALRLSFSRLALHVQLTSRCVSVLKEVRRLPRVKKFVYHQPSTVRVIQGLRNRQDIQDARGKCVRPVGLGQLREKKILSESCIFLLVQRQWRFAILAADVCITDQLH